MLLTQSNIAYYLTLMHEIRQAIFNKTLEEFILKTTEDWKKGDFE
jgi:queuine tRNA-ribosyltransferase